MPIPMLGSIAAGLAHNPLADEVIQSLNLQRSDLTDGEGRLKFDVMDARFIIRFVAGLDESRRRSLSELAMSDAGKPYADAGYNALCISPHSTGDPDRKLVIMAAAGLALTIAVRLDVNFKL